MPKRTKSRGRSTSRKGSRKVSKKTRQVKRRKTVRRAIKKKSTWGTAFDVASQLGSLVHPGLGAALRLAGKAIPMLTGHGDYDVGSNTLGSHGGTAMQAPQFSGGSGGFRIKHREFVKDILMTTAFTNTRNRFNLNPGNTILFPWLSSIATEFEQWKPHGIVIEFRTTSVDSLNSTNTALGTVIMCTDYNVLSAPYGSKQEMENSFFCSTSKPSENCLHPIECAPGSLPMQWMYVRPNANTSYQGAVVSDLRFSDMGQFQLATSGGPQQDVVIGELWISYDVEFQKPILPALQDSNPGNLQLGANYAFGASPPATVGTAPLNPISRHLPFGSAQLKLYDTFPGSLAFSSNQIALNTYPSVTDVGRLNTVTIPAIGPRDRYRLNFTWQGGPLPTLPPTNAHTLPIVFIRNGRLPNLYANNTTPPSTAWVAFDLKTSGAYIDVAENYGISPWGNSGLSNPQYQPVVDIQSVPWWVNAGLGSGLSTNGFTHPYTYLTIDVWRQDNALPMDIAIDFMWGGVGSSTPAPPGPTFGLGTVPSQGMQMLNFTILSVPAFTTTAWDGTMYMG